MVWNGHMITYCITVFMFHCISMSWALDQDTQNCFCSWVCLGACHRFNTNNHAVVSYLGFRQSWRDSSYSLSFGIGIRAGCMKQPVRNLAKIMRTIATCKISEIQFNSAQVPLASTTESFMPLQWIATGDVTLNDLCHLPFLAQEISLFSSVEYNWHLRELL